MKLFERHLKTTTILIYQFTVLKISCKIFDCQLKQLLLLTLYLDKLKKSYYFKNEIKLGRFHLKKHNFGVFIILGQYSAIFSECAIIT
jgi:hypothetical protein